ncbi:MAG: hypothetical protein ABIM78_07070 [candidate division WOR-3 bacterium]
MINFVVIFLYVQTLSLNPFVQNFFNPDISLISDFSFVGIDIKDEWREELLIPEFISHSHSHISKSRGFNFNYLELVFSAFVDPYFELFSINTINPEYGIEIHELYGDAKFLPSGIGSRIGIFKSEIGRHNSKHAHYWDFNDSPIIYDALLGSEGLSGLGLRITYTFPFNLFLKLGSEIFQNSYEEPVSFNADGYEFLDKKIESFSKPSLFTGYIKTSFDFINHVFLLGSSIIYGASNIFYSNHHKETSFNSAISSPGTVVYGFDVSYKYIIDAYRYISFQGEYLSRIIDGKLYLMSETDTNLAIERDLYKINSGLYSEIVFKLNRRIRMGLRGDYLFEPFIKIDGNISQSDIKNLYKISFMAEYNFTEFSRIRFQYNYDHTKYFEEKMRPINEFILSINLSIGAHGAHMF